MYVRMCVHVCVDMCADKRVDMNKHMCMDMVMAHVHTAVGGLDGPRFALRVVRQERPTEF